MFTRNMHTLSFSFSIITTTMLNFIHSVCILIVHHHVSQSGIRRPREKLAEKSNCLRVIFSQLPWLGNGGLTLLWAQMILLLQSCLEKSIRFGTATTEGGHRYFFMPFSNDAHLPMTMMIMMTCMYCIWWFKMQCIMNAFLQVDTQNATGRYFGALKTVYIWPIIKSNKLMDCGYFMNIKWL